MTHSIDRDHEDAWRRQVGNPVVDIAERALRSFGDRLTAADVRLLLPLWAHYAQLSPRERAAVLARFEDPS